MTSDQRKEKREQIGIEVLNYRIKNNPAFKFPSSKETKLEQLLYSEGVKGAFIFKFAPEDAVKDRSLFVTCILSKEGNIWSPLYSVGVLFKPHQSVIKEIEEGLLY